MYKVECRKIGIEGEQIKSELVELVKNLPHEFNEIANKAGRITDISDFYATFVEFAIGRYVILITLGPWFSAAGPRQLS